jgi:hypothetical protein
MSTIMPLNVQNPDDATNPTKSVLMQFKGAADHLTVPPSSSTTGPGDLNLELLVDTDVCKDLCNRAFTIALEEAVLLKDGTVSAHASHDLMLDCAKKGDSKLCASPKGAVQKGTDAGTKGAQGSGPKTQDASVARGDTANGGAGSGGAADGGANLQLDGGPSIPFDAGTLPDLTCANQKHVPASALCNGVDDCGDGTDELACGDASAGQFPCPGGGITTMAQLCDGKKDCSDGFDEMVCLPCADGSKMYSPYKQCDGKQDCADGTDEMGCDFTCTSGEHIPTAKFCNGTPDCKDGSDETPCQFQCGDGTSVPSSKICDMHADCANGADEAKPMCP